LPSLTGRWKMHRSTVLKANALAILLLGLLLQGCSGSGDSADVPDSGTEADADADADADGRVEADVDETVEVDAGGDADADADAEADVDETVEADADGDADAEAEADADVPIICTPNAPYCTSTTSMATCNPEGTGPVGLELNCREMRNTDCNPTTGDCYFCNPDQYFCISDTMFDQCNSEGTAGVFPWSCMWGLPCRWSTGTCYVCWPGEPHCVSETDWMYCNDDGSDVVGLVAHHCARGCNPATESCIDCVGEGAHCDEPVDCCMGFECIGGTCQNPCGGVGAPCHSGGCCQDGLRCDTKTPTFGIYRCCHEMGGSCTGDGDCCGALVCDAGICNCQAGTGVGNWCLDAEECCPDEFGLRYCYRPTPTAYGACCRISGPCLSSAVCCSPWGFRCNADGNCGPLPG
jgi:hypothetical protein